MYEYRLRLLALACSALCGSSLRAIEPDIEVYVGTRKVAPKPPADPAAGPRAVGSVMRTLQSSTEAAVDSTGKVLARMLERSVPKWELPQVPVVVHVTLPSATPAKPEPSPIVAAGGFHSTGFSGSTGTGPPALLPWVRANSATEIVPVRSEPRDEPKPTVIVVRDAAVAPIEAPGVKLSAEVLIATVAFFGIALIGTILTVARRSAPATRAAMTAEPIPVPTGHVAVGGRDAGPLSPTAEKFDLGPTYSEQKIQEQVAAAASEDAIVQLILAQNIAMQAEIAK